MPPSIEELLARIRALEEELEREYAQGRDEFTRQRAAMAERVLALQREHKVGLWRYLRHSRWPVLLTAPLIYAGWPVFALLDGFVSLYQAVCFPVYGIPRVRRYEHLVFDRAGLPYLNLLERLNCFYCSYGNGVVSYAREVAARTEQYWCPIKHARRVTGAHGRYPEFFAHGDAEAFRLGQERLRARLAALDATSESDGQPPASPPT
jgi:hypothetical protein